MMIYKIDFKNDFSKDLDTGLISGLYRSIEGRWGDIRTILLDIDDVVRESDTRRPVLYGIVPYIVGIVAGMKRKKDLGSAAGRTGISTENRTGK